MARDGLIWFDVDVFQDAMDSAVGDAEKAVKAATRSTMGKTRRHARTLLSALIREKWNIKKRDLDKKIRVRVGSRLGDYYESFEMTIRGMSISMAYFAGTRQRSGAVTVSRSGKGGYASRRGRRASKKQGVEVEIRKGKKSVLRRSWLHFAPSGHVAVMQRKGKSRYPIQVKAVISPASMFEDAEVADRFEEGLIDFLERTFEHELAWQLQRAGLA